MIKFRSQGHVVGHNISEKAEDCRNHAWVDQETLEANPEWLTYIKDNISSTQIGDTVTFTITRNEKTVSGKASFSFNNGFLVEIDNNRHFIYFEDGKNNFHELLLSHLLKKDETEKPK